MIQPIRFRPGEVTAEQVTTLESATTVQGADNAISIKGDSVFVDEAPVTMTDIATSNGLIHVIDAGLMLPEAGSSPCRSERGGGPDGTGPPLIPPLSPRGPRTIAP